MTEFERRRFGASRALLGVSGLFGAFGVGLAAAASHVGGGAFLQLAAAFLLFHAVALLGLAAVGLAWPGSARAFAFVGLAMAAGTALFAGDLSLRALLGDRLFPGAAPAGGTILILSWLGLALAGLFAGRRG